MNYNDKSRKRNSKLIIDKVSDLDQEVSNYKSRIDDLVDELTEDGEEEKSNRENFLEYIHFYLDHFEELKLLDRYRWNNNSAPNFLKSLKTISIKQYIPGWSEFYSDDVTFTDCSYLWNVFYPYSSSRDTETIRASCLWNDTDLRAVNQQKAKPNPPSSSEFQNSIVALKEKSYVVAKDVLNECEKSKNVILNGNLSKTHDYSYIYDINQFTITPSGTKISYSNFNSTASFGYKAYTVEACDSKKTENYAKTLINGEFAVGKIHFFSSDDNSTFGFGKVSERHVKAERLSLKPEYLQAQTTASTGTSSGASSSFQSAVYDSDDRYWNCNYYASITFEFDYINGSSSMKPFGSLTDDLCVSFLKNYHSNLLSILSSAYSKYQEALENIKTSDNGKYEEYLKYLEEADYSSLSKAVAVNNTVVNTIKSWVLKRISDIFETVNDEVVAEAIRSIISERMNKNSGTLFSWYAQKSLPVAESYNTYKQKIQDSLYIFKTMLAAEVLNLDYTLDENGGEEIFNPNFVDIDKDRYSYYKLAGKNVDFNINDSIYILDDNNPEFSAKILSFKTWTGKYNNEEVELKRLYLDKTISDVYDKESLRIVKLF